MQERKKQAWGSRFGLIMAMAGSAVGLGNFIRFPVQAIQNGGGAFIIPYLLSFVLLGIPVCIIEWASGKYAGLRGHHSPPMIAQSLSSNRTWKYIGSMGIFSSFVISAYYCYIESWCLVYTIHALSGSFLGITAQGAANFFSTYLSLHQSTLGIPYENIFFYLFCVALNGFVLARGIKNGIEKVSKWMMPMLFLLAIILVIRAFTIKAGVDGAHFDGLTGFDFLWNPQFDSLSNPKVWLAAAGQIFFTCSLGMGALECYASFLRANDDIVLNSITACFTNEFAEVCLGASIIIPISIGYYGIDNVIAMTQTGGMGLGFVVLPYLFSQWGPFLAVLTGFCFFGLLFFASLTSILSISTPTIEYLVDEFSFSRRKAALFFCSLLMFVGLPSVIWFNQGVFDELDFWGGTVSLFVYGTLETILFFWVFGMERGWKLITNNANLKLPLAFKFIMKYVSPLMLLTIFVAACIKPAGDDWSQLSLRGWRLDNGSVIGMLRHQGIGPNKTWYAHQFYAENEGTVDSLYRSPEGVNITVSGQNYIVQSSCSPTVKVGQTVKVGDALYQGSVINKVCYIDITRISLLLLFLFLCFTVRYAVRHPKNYVCI